MLFYVKSFFKEECFIVDIKILKILSLITSIFGLLILILSWFYAIFEWLIILSGIILVILGLINFYLFSKRY